VKLGFCDEIVYEKGTPLDEQKMADIARKIESAYQVEYHWKQTEKGFRMWPSAEITLEKRMRPHLLLTEKDGKITVRRYMGAFVLIFFGLAACFQILLICLLLFGQMDFTPVAFLPLSISAFDYVIIKIGSTIDGKPILKCVMDVLQE
jgi:hypothetical protein